MNYLFRLSDRDHRYDAMT